MPPSSDWGSTVHLRSQLRSLRAFDVFGLFAFSLAKQAQREEARHDEGMDAAVSLHVIRTDMISASVADVCTWSVLSCPTCMSMMTMIL